MSDKEQIGRLAQDVLENEAFKEAFNRVERKLTRACMDTGPADVAVRESAYASMKLLEEVKWELEFMLDEGNRERINRKALEDEDDKIKGEKKRKQEYFESTLAGTRDWSKNPLAQLESESDKEKQDA